MLIGFTGTREGLKPAQRQGLLNLLSNLKDVRQAHHGDCTGADQEFHEAVEALFNETVIIVSHPPINNKFRAYCDANITFPTKDYLERNDDIVNSCDALIAAPNGFEEIKRSGTWYTVRRAREAGKLVIIVYPDGTLEKENYGV